MGQAETTQRSFEVEKEEQLTTDATINMKLSEWVLDPNDVDTIDENNIWTVKNFLSRQECDELTQHSEKLGYGEGVINGSLVMSDVRNNKRTVWTDTKFCEQIWNRAKHCVPKFATQLKMQQANGEDFYSVGCYEDMRFYRYDACEKFEPHFDGIRRKKNGDKSFLTCIIYLNDVNEGGRTNFYDYNGQQMVPLYSVKPTTGTCLFFVHTGMFNLHEGEMIPENSTERKYVLRTDVMYRRD
jgi:predicted 2-oxoglutarate/Fe(II)-dependent dioxygenase YbiX